MGPCRKTLEERRLEGAFLPGSLLQAGSAFCQGRAGAGRQALRFPRRAQASRKVKGAQAPLGAWQCRQRATRRRGCRRRFLAYAANCFFFGGREDARGGSRPSPSNSQRDAAGRPLRARQQSSATARRVGRNHQRELCGRVSQGPPRQLSPLHSTPLPVYRPGVSPRPGRSAAPHLLLPERAHAVCRAHSRLASPRLSAQGPPCCKGRPPGGERSGETALLRAPRLACHSDFSSAALGVELRLGQGS